MADATLASKLDEIVAHKRTEVAGLYERQPLDQWRRAADQSPWPIRDFAASLRRHSQPPERLAVIAEIKRASPSAGTIAGEIDAQAVARTYAGAGAACISVLTDERFFAGDNQTLTAVRSLDLPPPVLRKDFLIDPVQVYEARAIGADAVLLIAECLSPDTLAELFALTRELGMQALVELYDEANLDAVLAIGPDIVGVNNRDLATFAVDIDHSRRLRARVPRPVLFVSESGLRTGADTVPLLGAEVDAVLVGETLMRSGDVAATLAELATGTAP